MISYIDTSALIKKYVEENGSEEVEFTTAPQNGVIKIPQDYKDWFSQTVRVILLSDADAEIPEQDVDNTELRTFFDQFNADLTGYHFDREDTNAR